RAPDPPSRYPAPWYYAAVLLCLLATVPAFRPEVVVPPENNAANRQVSDNPIGPEDLDALGLGEIALGLSQFFRNVDTKPPWTVGGGSFGGTRCFLPGVAVASRGYDHADRMGERVGERPPPRSRPDYGLRAFNWNCPALC